MVESGSIIAKQNEETLRTETNSHHVLYFEIICVQGICFQFQWPATERFTFLSLGNVPGPNINYLLSVTG
jgi:hypothetical protein